jgi:hypothetical protein
VDVGYLGNENEVLHGVYTDFLLLFVDSVEKSAAATAVDLVDGFLHVGEFLDVIICGNHIPPWVDDIDEKAVVLTFNDERLALIGDSDVVFIVILIATAQLIQCKQDKLTGLSLFYIPINLHPLLLLFF